jgi:hypothetical protein
MTATLSLRRGLAPDNNVTLVLDFNQVGVFSLHTRFSAQGRSRQDTDRATTNLLEGFDAALAAAALP